MGDLQWLLPVAVVAAVGLALQAMLVYYLWSDRERLRKERKAMLSLLPGVPEDVRKIVLDLWERAQAIVDKTFGERF